jgi:enoyl-CoA hydratase
MPIRYEIERQVATIVVAGATPRNLLNREMCAELATCFERLDVDPSARVAILTSEGPHFSGGIDLGALLEFLETATPSVILAEYWHKSGVAPVSIGESPLFGRRTLKPVVAAIRGECLNEAFAAVTFHADIRVASNSARFGFPSVRYGIGGAFGIRSRLAGQIPRAVLMWLVETGEEVDAGYARRHFLINEVVPDDEVLARARAIADAIAQLPDQFGIAEKSDLYRIQDGRGGVDL